MNKIAMFFATVLVLFSLAGCDKEDTPPVNNDGLVEVVDLTTMTFSEALAWASTNKVRVSGSGVYSDDVLPNTVLSQNVEVGTWVEEWTTISVTYSRGYDPDGVIVVPDFTGMTREDIESWLEVNDISKYDFFNTFAPDVSEGGYVGYEVDKIYEDNEFYVRRDQYNFYFSNGPLVVETVEFDELGTVRGVNLGGWFVLESWMTPELFEGINGAHDETTWIINNPNAEAELKEHWETFITEEDFQYLSEHGIDYVRLPIPWWMWGDTAYETTPFQDNMLPHNEDGLKDYAVTYISSVEYINQAMLWAEQYNIKVLVDLHTAPGGQNGFDNGGLSGVNVWAEPEYVTLTLFKIREMVQHFNQFESFWGFEVLNEPSWGVPLHILQDFYVDSYNIIRAYNPDVWVGFHDGFRMYLENEWTTFFTENNFTNVFFDIHLYQVFGDDWGKMDIFEHIEWVHVEQAKAVHRYDGIVPVIVGEWSGGLPTSIYQGIDPQMHNDIKEAFLSAQLNVYEEGMGHFFWSYQILQGSHMEWDIVRLIEAGLVPSDWSPGEEAE